MYGNAPSHHKRKLSTCQLFSCLGLPSNNCWYNWDPRRTDTFPCRSFRSRGSIKLNKNNSWKMPTSIRALVKPDLLYNTLDSIARPLDVHRLRVSITFAPTASKTSF